MTFREAVKQAKRVLITARGNSFKTTKKEIWKAVHSSEYDKKFDDSTAAGLSADSTVEIYSQAFDFYGVHVRVYLWKSGTVLEVNLTPSYA